MSESSYDFLRREKMKAIMSQEFDRAELIDQQIERLRGQESQRLEKTMDEDRDFTNRERKKRIMAESAIETSSFASEREILRQNFRKKLASLRAMHERQLEELASEQQALVDREGKRVMNDVRVMLRGSQQLAMDREFAQAKAVFKDAMRTQNTTVSQRQLKCEVDSARRERKLRARQRAEIAHARERYEVAVTELGMREEASSVVTEKAIRAVEVKTARQKAVERQECRRGRSGIY